MIDTDFHSYREAQKCSYLGAKQAVNSEVVAINDLFRADVRALLCLLVLFYMLYSVVLHFTLVLANKINNTTCMR